MKQGACLVNQSRNFTVFVVAARDVISKYIFTNLYEHKKFMISYPNYLNPRHGNVNLSVNVNLLYSMTSNDQLSNLQMSMKILSICIHY